MRWWWEHERDGGSGLGALESLLGLDSLGTLALLGNILLALGCGLGLGLLLD
jgi:hypothetical protein